MAFIAQTKRNLAIWVMSLGAQAYTLTQEICGALAYILPGGFDPTQPQIHGAIQRLCNVSYPKPLAVNSTMLEIGRYLDTYSTALHNYDEIKEKALATYSNTLSATLTSNAHLRLGFDFPNRTCLPSPHKGCLYTVCNRTALVHNQSPHLSMVDWSFCHSSATANVASNDSCCCCFLPEKVCTAPSSYTGIHTWLADPTLAFRHGGKLRFTLTPNMLCDPKRGVRTKRGTKTLHGTLPEPTASPVCEPSKGCNVCKTCCEPYL